MKPISILLLFSLLTSNFGNLFIFTGFELNREFIAAELCINKNKPELNCKGKCYLMKKLKQAQEKEDKQERQSQKTQAQDALVELPLKFKQYAFGKVACHIPISMGIPLDNQNVIFQPPPSRSTF